MSEATLEAIDKLLEKKFEEKLEPINTKLDAIQETVASHTASLDGIAKTVNELNQATKVYDESFGKHEKAIKFVAEKVGMTETVKNILQA
jgi:hypothetical protein